jgi:PadR family transcriptional regulator PadR
VQYKEKQIMQQETNKNNGCSVNKTNFTSSCMLEMLVLSLLLYDDAYGYRIAKSDYLQIPESKIYPILRRLNENGFLEAYTQLNNAKLRKIYRITAKGIERYRELETTWYEHSDIVNFLLSKNSAASVPDRFVLATSAKNSERSL